MVLLSLVLGCATKSAPVVFPVPLPEVEQPRAPEVEVGPRDCSVVVPYAPPYAEGQAPACEGLLVPPAVLAGYLHAEALAGHWERQAARCGAWRAVDREHGQALYDACWAGWQASERDGKALRLWAPIGIGLVGAGAFVLGYEAGRTIP